MVLNLFFHLTIDIMLIQCNFTFSPVVKYCKIYNFTLANDAIHKTRAHLSCKNGFHFVPIYFDSFLALPVAFTQHLHEVLAQ